MRKLPYLGALFALCACAGGKPDYSTKTDAEILALGTESVEKEDYIGAVESLSQLEYNHPYSRLTGNSWILIGYSQYRDKKYADAVESFERLIKYQPSNPQVPYAMYMVAMSYYDQMSPITRDQRMTELALSSMEKLDKAFPDSEYAADIKPKMQIARNHLAAKEMYIAKNLVARQNIIAALNRYQTIIAKYDATPFIEEALFRTVEIYLMMDEAEAAGNMARILEANYPNSKWLAMAKDIIGEYAKSGERPESDVDLRAA
jgi:outer membrane protein assembly factor BamD